MSNLPIFIHVHGMTSKSPISLNVTEIVGVLTYDDPDDPENEKHKAHSVILTAKANLNVLESHDQVIEQIKTAITEEHNREYSLAVCRGYAYQPYYQPSFQQCEASCINPSDVKVSFSETENSDFCKPDNTPGNVWHGGTEE